MLNQKGLYETSSPLTSPWRSVFEDGRLRNHLIDSDDVSAVPERGGQVAPDEPAAPASKTLIATLRQLDRHLVADLDR